MKKSVVDTNIFISALLKSPNCAEILEALKRGDFELVMSEKMAQEVLIVASRPKFEFSEFEKRELREMLLEKSKSSIDFPEKISICRDEKDNVVLECASAGKADFIVTGDEDLLSLKTFRKTLIVTPRRFLQIIKK